ncbi:MAG: hypothetical protein JW751_09800 [Polyangiaceae bacterium]|nr:hypothetical protein [Polyangiaceae bacterium]
MSQRMPSAPQPVDAGMAANTYLPASVSRSDPASFASTFAAARTFAERGWPNISSRLLLEARLTQWSALPTRRMRTRSLGAEVPGAYVVATKRGLYRVAGGEIELLSQGQFYGVAKTGRQLLAFRMGLRAGAVWAVDPHPWRGWRAVSTVVRHLSRGVHQIDLGTGGLYLCDTYNNALRVFSTVNPEYGRAVFPRGRLDHGRGSENYAHLNSVYVTPSRIYLVCHNESAKTGRPSELLVLDHHFALVDRRPFNGRSVHNVVPTANGLLYCDSLGGRVMLDDRPIYEPGWFTRGLSLSEEYLVVGGSDYAGRDERVTGAGFLAVLDRKTLAVRTEIRFPAMVQEIRRLDGIDLAASEGWFTAASCRVGSSEPVDVSEPVFPQTRGEYAPRGGPAPHPSRLAQGQPA